MERDALRMRDAGPFVFAQVLVFRLLALCYFLGLQHPCYIFSSSPLISLILSLRAGQTWRWCTRNC